MPCVSVTVGGTPITPNDFMWVMYLGAGGLIFAAGYLIYTGFFPVKTSSNTKERSSLKKVK